MKMLNWIMALIAMTICVNITGTTFLPMFYPDIMISPETEETRDYVINMMAVLIGTYAGAMLQKWKDGGGEG